MGRASLLEVGFADLAAVFFAVGGVASLVMTLLTVPLFNFSLPVNLNTALLVILGVSLVCSLGSLHCYTLATKRMLSEAGMRGLIFGALLLILSLGVIGNFSAPATSTSLAELSAVLVLIGGIMCFILRHTVLSTSPIMREQAIQQRT